jgi:hypothetical protein
MLLLLAASSEYPEGGSGACRAGGGLGACCSKLERGGGGARHQCREKSDCTDQQTVSFHPCLLFAQREFFDELTIPGQARGLQPGHLALIVPTAYPDGFPVKKFCFKL